MTEFSKYNYNLEKCTFKLAKATRIYTREIIKNQIFYQVAKTSD